MKVEINGITRSRHKYNVVQFGTICKEVVSRSAQAQLADPIDT